MSKKRKDAQYECVACNRKFWGWPGPEQANDKVAECPRCGSVYLAWLNYEEWREEHPTSDYK